MPREAFSAGDGVAGGDGAGGGGNEIKSKAQDVVGLLGDGVGGGEVMEGLVENLVEVTRRGSVTQSTLRVLRWTERERGRGGSRSW